MLTVASPLLTRPTYSSMTFGLLPAASVRVGVSISVGIVFSSRLHCRGSIPRPASTASRAPTTTLTGGSSANCPKPGSAYKRR
jgi:hypothetical protein